jgi:hypothetical protein
MANALYPKWKEQLLQFTANNDLSLGTVKVALVDTGVYTYSSSDQYYSALSGAVVGTPQTIGSKTFTNGVFDGSDVTYSTLSGNSVEAIVIFIDTGNASTSPLVAYFDTDVNGLPVIPNGGDIVITWNASGIFAL